MLEIYAFVSLARNVCYGQHLLQEELGRCFGLILSKVMEDKGKKVWGLANPLFLLPCDFEEYQGFENRLDFFVFLCITE